MGTGAAHEYRTGRHSFMGVGSFLLCGVRDLLQQTVGEKGTSLEASSQHKHLRCDHQWLYITGHTGTVCGRRPGTGWAPAGLHSTRRRSLSGGLHGARPPQVTAPNLLQGTINR